MSSVNLEDLSLQEEEGFVFDFEEGEDELVDFRWCLIGRFLGDRSIHTNSMKVTLADVWRPVKGVKIKEAKTGLFLFQFAHEMDMAAVLQGGPWSFNNQMLIVGRVQVGVQIENIPLNHVDFWVQVHNLPMGLMAEKVGRTLANYIGSFVEYDKNNRGSFWREYMRIRVRVDIRRPLKKESKVKNQGGEWCTVNFKYEKLGVFCFVCGLIGHGENKCEVLFSMTEDDGSRAWSKDLRAEPRRRSAKQTSRWLMEDGGGRSVQEGEQSFDASAAHVDPTRSSSSASASHHNRPGNDYQSLLCPTIVPSAIPGTQNLAHPIISQSMTCPAITANTETETEQSLNSSQSINHHLTIIPKMTAHNSLADNTLMTKSFANNNQPIKSFSISPIINGTFNPKPIQPFSFKADVANKIQPIHQNTRSSKNNPPHRTNRPNNTITRTETKPDAAKPVPALLQITPVSMEVQTEKKRRREEEKKESDDNSNLTQHFLTAGPGSQACRDQ
jgi:14-3-3 protein epsilon